MNKKLSDGSCVIHAGLPPAKQGQPFSDGPVFASTFHLSGDPSNAKYKYGRFAQPTWDVLESAIAELEQGQVAIFPSGMAASASVLTSLVSSGDKIVLPSDGYTPTSDYVETFLAKFGVKAKLVPTLEMPTTNFDGIKLVFIETPSNPMLDVVDIRALSEKVRAAGALLAVDNTALTVLGQQPLLLGADISVSSDSKAFNGHSDVLFGHVAAKDEKILEVVKNWRKLSGSIPGPMETWLVHRSLATLDVRLDRMVSNAQEIAELLQKHDAVSLVRYPGLPADPSYGIACAQMKHFGFVISFELKDEKTANNFLTNSEMIFEATSFGGIHTTAERRARWGTPTIAAGLIRMSVGCERIEDLIADISDALDLLLPK